MTISNKICILCPGCRARIRGLGGVPGIPLKARKGLKHPRPRRGIRFPPGAPYLSVLLLSLLLTACSGSSTGPQPLWDQAEKGVQLTFKADQQVNFYEQQPHAVAVAVLQLAEPTGFSQLLTYSAGLQQILTANKDLPSSLVADHFFLQPGESVEKIYDRAESAKWLLIAAGIYSARPEQSAMLVKIPFNVERSWLTFSKEAVIPTYKETVLLTKNALKLETSPD